MRWIKIGQGFFFTASIITSLSVAPAFGRQPSALFGRIAGRVTFDGKPVRKAIVLAMSFEETERSAVTDDLGSYLLGNLPPGDYFVTVIHPQYVPDSNEVASGYALKTVSDASAKLDFTLVKGAVITGTMCDARGNPIVGERVFYEKLDRPNTAFSFMTLRQKIFTDDLGYFRIYGLPSGKYIVGIGKNVGTDLGKSGSPFKATFYPDVENMAEAEVIELEAGRVRDLGKIKVRNSDKGFSAAIKFVDKDGKPVRDFSFDLIKIALLTGSPNRTAFRTGSDGLVRIGNLEPSQYQILPAVATGRSGVLGFAPRGFEIVDKDILDLVITCDSPTVHITGVIRIRESVPATSGDCMLALKEGDDLLANDKPSYQVPIRDGTFYLSGLRETIYTLIIVPKRRSLHYEYSEMDGLLVANKQAVGQLTLDLRQGSKRLVIQLMHR